MTFGSRPSVCALTGALFLFQSLDARAADPAPAAPAPSTAPAAPAPSAPAPQAAPKVDEAAKKEAAERFDRGLMLFDEGDNAGALAEFKRTYELFPNTVVLYNIGLVYAAMNRPVDAVDSLEPAVSAGGLSATQLERAKKTLAESKARIGRLVVKTTPEGARVEVDNVEVARTPLTAPIRIAEGTHIVGAVAEGFAPARKEIVIAGNADASLSLELVPTEGKRLANLTVSTNTRGADVFVDKENVGKTPLPTSVTLVAGHHEVELRRPGYTPARREIDVGEGATGALEFDLAVDPSSLGREGATLALDTSESGAYLTVDGEQRGVYTQPLRVPRGPHHLTVTAAGFLPVEREVTLNDSITNVVRVDFEPTPEKRREYESNANFHRTWGWVGIVSGVVIGGAGAGFLVINGSSKSDKRDALNALNEANTASEPPCDWRHAMPCNDQLAQAQSDYDAAKNRDIYGYVGIGVGAAALVTGVVLLVTGDAPGKYDHSDSRSLGKKPAPRFAVVPGPGQGGAGFAMVF